MLGLSFLLFAALFSVNQAELTYALLFLTGIAMSAILPLLITLAGLLYPEMAGTILGTLKAAFPIGGMLIPFAISVVSQYGSFAAAVWVLPLSFLAAFGLFLLQLNTLEAVEFKPHLTSRT
jgi:MFS family permease